MALPPGTRFAQYEITGAIGQGGMGEVYRARDTKLNRDVAIKTLPPAFAEDRDRVSRFAREAQALAALNHPNIAQIYDVIESPSALVMELVEGEDLSVRIAGGAIPLKEALTLAGQIGDALECAHERGIIHRDLKPANIKVSETGAVKLLDFGLAKALVTDEAAALAGSDNSPTTTSPAVTQMGVILGTASYMSPEQAKGKAADRRSDVWAFGNVLFEMLAGRRPFAGADVSDVIAAVLRAEPDWDALPEDTPPAIRRLLRRCLEKDRSKRLDSMAVAKYEVQEVIATPQEQPPVGVVRGGAPGLASMIAVGAVCAIAAAFATWAATRPRAETPMVFRSQLTPVSPDELALDFFIGDLDVSPDGSAVAYAARRNRGVPEIFIRRADQESGIALAGTRDARGPSFSPDGQWVVYQLSADIRKVPVGGGAEQVVCAFCAGGFRGGTWLPDGSFVYSTAGGASGLRVLRPDAVAYEQLARPDASAGERAYTFPTTLPGGRGILFAIDGSNGSSVAVLDLRTNRVKVLAKGGGSPRYASSGHLLYAASGALYAVAFDVERLEATGIAVQVLTGLVTKSSGAADYAVASNGALVYVAGTALASTYTVTVGGRTGAREPLPLPPAGYVMGRFSPDGKQVVLDSRSGEQDLWIWNFDRKIARKLTFSPGADQYPVWTTDGRQIIYAGSDGKERAIRSIIRRNADGSGTPEIITTHSAALFPIAITPDGSTLLAHSPANVVGTDPGVFSISLTGDHTPRLVEGIPIDSLNPQISPDGKFIVYQTAGSSRSEIVVQPFPNVADGHWQVSTNGGVFPVFSNSGTELFYRDLERRLISVPVQLSPQFSAGTPSVMMEDVFAPGPGRPYDVSRDGQRVLLITESQVEKTGPPPQLNVVLNWGEELKRASTPKR